MLGLNVLPPVDLPLLELDLAWRRVRRPAKDALVVLDLALVVHLRLLLHQAVPPDHHIPKADRVLEIGPLKAVDLTFKTEKVLVQLVPLFLC